MAQVPVPNILKELIKYHSLETAVTSMVFNNPFGRIHGHDAERIELSMKNNSTIAIVVFVMPDSFVIHNDRILSCKLISDEWECEEFKISFVAKNEIHYQNEPIGICIYLQVVIAMSNNNYR